MTLNIMLDLETLGVGILPPIIQIGAVAFDEKCEELGAFNIFISREENEKVGAKADQSTLDWWEKQNDDAKKVLVRSSQSNETVESALLLFTDWISIMKTTTSSSPLVWGNGSTFDNRILEAHYLNLGGHKPWDYNADRDLRTLVATTKDFTGVNAKDVVFSGTPHNAVDDCRHQIKMVKYCHNALKSLNNPNLGRITNETL